MASGTKYNTKQELLDAIQSLVYENDNNETDSENIQKAIKNIVESMWDKSIPKNYSGITTSASAINLADSDSISYIPTVNNTAYNINLLVTAIQKDGASGSPGDFKVFNIQAGVKTSSNVTSTSSQYIDFTSGDIAANTWTAQIVTTGIPNSLGFYITVVGEANKNIYWNAEIISVKVNY